MYLCSRLLKGEQRVNNKDEKGSTLLLKLFVILFSVFVTYGYVFVHTVDDSGFFIFQKSKEVCNAYATSCFNMEVLYLFTLLVVAILGFISITVTTVEWTTQRESGFYRNAVAFLNCVKIAIAVIFYTMFFRYSKATLIIPMAVVSSLFLDSYVWNKRAREYNPKHESLLLDVVDEFMNIFNFKKNRRENIIRYKHSIVFYTVATLFILFCVHAVSSKIKPVFGMVAQESQAVAVEENSDVSAESSIEVKEPKLAKVKTLKKRRKKIAAVQEKIVKDTVSANTNEDEEDWW